MDVLDAKARAALTGVERALGSGLARMRVSANGLTATGLVLTGVAAALLLRDEVMWAGFTLVAAGVLDFLDGAVARAQGKASPLGALLDSVADRVSDGAVLGALFWVLMIEGRDVAAALALAALVLAQITSYTRAKAEALGYSCQVGIIERKERVALLVVGFVFGVIGPALWALGVLSTATVVQRIVHVARQAREHR